MIKKLKIFWRNLIYHPLFLGIILMLCFEWLHLDFKTFLEIPIDPVGNLIFLGVLIFITTLIAYYLLKMFSTTDFITETKLRNKLEELIGNADDFLFIVSPYLDPGNVVIESLIRAKKNDVHVVLIHHSNQLKKLVVRDDLSRLLDVGIEIYNHPNIHSKIYLNEKEVLIASLNLVSKSYSDSFEAGVYSDGFEIRKSIKDYIKGNILGSDKCSKTTLELLAPLFGYCIKTKQVISFNPSRPVEYNEYRKSDGNKIGKYCHSCGSEALTSIDSPFCDKCLQLNNSEE